MEEVFLKKDDFDEFVKTRKKFIEIPELSEKIGSENYSAYTENGFATIVINTASLENVLTIITLPNIVTPLFSAYYKIKDNEEYYQIDSERKTLELSFKDTAKQIGTLQISYKI